MRLRQLSFLISVTGSLFLIQMILQANNLGLYNWMSSCARKPANLLGTIPIDFDAKHLINRSVLYGGDVGIGGVWEPRCIARKKVAVLIPYRKRPEQLKVFLNHMHPILQRQQLSYRIFVVEQTGNVSFNKGAIYNIGFNLTMEFGDFECYIFHDVDLLSENDHNYYGCPSSPMHMSPAIDKFHYMLSYATLVGGIQAISKSDYIKINGYSNRFYGWGGEDDNLYQRIASKGLKLTRPNMKIGRYKMNKLHHYRSDGMNPQNVILLKKRRPKASLDGIRSIKHLKHEFEIHLRPLYTLFSVRLLS